MPQQRTYRRGRPSRPQNNTFRNSRPGRSGGRRQPKKVAFDHAKFVRPAKPQTEEVFVPEHLFSDFRVHALLKKNLQRMGFQKPSPIQDQAIPVGLNGQDIVGIANTGTGKTAAFAIPVLHRLMTEPESRAIIIAPTRELAEQIRQQTRTIGRNSNIDGPLLIGGSSMGFQLRDLRRNPRIVIGTPGRIKDHLERGTLNLSAFNIVVLDEVDRMLDMGFVHDMTHILGQTSQTRQSLYFSATLDDRVKRIIEGFSSDPVYITVTSGRTSDNVDQNIIGHDGTDKIDKLHDLLIGDMVTKTIIFDDTQRSVERLSRELITRGFIADSIHGGKSQSQRRRVLSKFKNNEVQVLVATDVAARGIDVSDITHVVNYSMPQTYDDYVHRIGRAGRAGRTGYALTFVDNKEIRR